MPTVSNKTQKPLSISLPGGKTLHLGPGKTGQVGAKAIDSARVKHLIEAGTIEISDDDDTRSGPGGGGDKRGRTSFYGHPGGGIRRSGDR